MELYLEHGYLMVSMYDKQYICPVRVSLRLRDVWAASPRSGFCASPHTAGRTLRRQRRSWPICWILS